MDNLYIFSIGGSGAKCLEALTFLCAAGFGPKEIHPILIDPDQDNGNLNRTTDIITSYSRIRSQLNDPTEGTFFYTDIKNPYYWNPLTCNDETTKTLRDVICYNTLSQEERMLADLLFSKDQQKLNLEYGFRGIPSIGSVVMRQIKNQDSFKEILHSLNGSNNNKGFIFGSIFGGTGASGYPVISQIMKSRGINNKVGGVILTPYFYLKSPHSITDSIKPDSSTFILNTVSAIPFYNRDVKSDVNYVLGDIDIATLPEYRLGGSGQLNKSHFIELIAALAALDFSITDNGLLNRFNALKVSTPEGENNDTSIHLKDLPLGKEGYRLLFSFGLFINSFRRIFQSINNKELDKFLYKITWLKNKLNIDVDLIKPELKNIYIFLEKFITWHRELSHNDAPLKLYTETFEFHKIFVNEDSRLKNHIEDELDKAYLHNSDAYRATPIHKIISTMNAGINYFISKL